MKKGRKTGWKIGKKAERKRQQKRNCNGEGKKENRHREEKYLLHELDYIMKTLRLANDSVCLIIWVPFRPEHNEG